jgi:hypothetical protein
LRNSAFTASRPSVNVSFIRVGSSVTPELANHPHEIIRELGNGGIDIVYLIRNLLTDRTRSVRW